MVNIKTLPIELQKVAETELGEVETRIPEDLEAIKTWIEKQPHLNARLDDQFLIQFLRGCKYSLETSKTKIDQLFTLKTKFPDLFNATDVHDANFRRMFNYGYGLPLPRPVNDNGARIFFMKFEGDIAKGLIDIEELYSTINAMHEILLMDDPYACVNGILYVIDLKDISFNMVLKLTPSFLQKTVQFYTKTLPFRIKGYYLINTPSFFQTVLNIFMPMLSEKLKKRVFVYGQKYINSETEIPIKYLPFYLGGENGRTEEHLKLFANKWLEYENYFKENKNYGTNELLRPGKPIDFDSLYGLGGSFRKLDLD